MPTPNSALRAVRMSMRLSQDDLARALREAGADTATKRLVQRWESGEIVSPRPSYARALERVTGLPLASLGFSVQVPGYDAGGLSTRAQDDAPVGLPATRPTARAQFSGIWLSRYEYYSSGRAQNLTGLHYVLVLQHDDRLQVRSLPGASRNPDSPLTMDLTVDGNIVTGTWVERTAKESYYRGATYHGAIQMLVDPSGRRMVGKWVGFGSEMDINTGPWELVFQDASTNKAAMESYSRPPQE
jgi:transcriptional regulator with XRE-family HTH domain